MAHKDSSIVTEDNLDIFLFGLNKLGSDWDPEAEQVTSAMEDIMHRTNSLYRQHGLGTVFQQFIARCRQKRYLPEYMKAPPPDGLNSIQPLNSMSGKPKLYYFNGRGRMESVRWLLAGAGVEFEEEFLETREQYETLLKDGFLLFQQVPMVEIDGMRLVQTRAILNYLAAKHNLYGKNPMERALIDVYVEGTTDLMGMIRVHHKLPPEEKERNLDLIIERATKRYFPVYEKVLKDNGQHFLLGSQLTWADVQLIEAILMAEEKEATILTQFPLLQAFKARMCDVPTIKKFLQPGSQRKPPPDAAFVATANRVFNRK